MGKFAVKCKKRYVDFPRDILKLTSLICGLGHSSYNFKVLNDFGTRYSAIIPFKERRYESTSDKKYKKNQEVNSTNA